MTEKEKLWSKHIKSQGLRNQTQREYCKFHGLNIHTFRFWKSKLLKPSQPEDSPSTPKQNGFIPIQVIKRDSNESKKIPFFKLEVNQDMSISITFKRHDESNVC